MTHPARREFLQQAASAAVLVGIGGAGPALAQAPDDEISPSERAAMAGIAAAYLRDFGVPGLSVAIAQRGRLAYAEGFGNSAAGQSITPASLFRIASVSKPFTSVAVFSLIEVGRLGLGDKVFGPGGILAADYQAPPNGRYIEEIMVEHLLTHTSGGWSNDNHDPMFSNPQMTQRELIAWTLAHVPLANAPGAAYAYSNFGFCVLGRIIEKVTGQSYASYVRTSVLDRCGITRMRIAGNTRSQRAPDEVVYTAQGGDPYGMNVARMDSHGGWIASASDLVRFAMHVDGRSDTPNILQPAAIKTMTTPSAVNPRYAKGWIISGHNWWHNGGLPGTSAVMVRTQSGFCWAALANSRRGNPDSVAALDRTVWQMVRAVKSFAA
jgi:CubicO group peptidase (beta-lactamase class C family)